MSSNDTIPPGACPVHKAELPEKPFIQQGQVTFQAHQVGWIICGFFTLVAVGVSGWLINKHLTNYTNKGQQRYIVRCLLLVPIYAIISTASYIFYDSYASPLILIRDAYESIVLHAFFWLLLEYISHDPVEQKEAFREIKLEKWMFPLGFIKRKPSGLYFLQIMKWGVLQYAVLRPSLTIIALILNWFGLYCEDSWSPRWGYVWITVILSISVSVAMYCLLQLYMPIAHILKPHQPVLKFLSIKSVVFLTFWQSTFLSVLAMFNVVKDSPYMTAEEINIGFAALLETFEMMVFAFLHIKAFSYKPYLQDRSNAKKTPRLRSFAHAMDFRDTFKQFWAGCVYMYERMRGFEPDRNERHGHLERAMGHRRRVRGPGDRKDAKDMVDDDEEAAAMRRHQEHPWLNLESDIGLLRNADGFEEEINTELRRLRMISEYEKQKKGKKKKKESSHRRELATSEKGDERDIFTGGSEETFKYRGPKKERSFWRGLYDRVSGGGGREAVSQVDDDEQWRQPSSSLYAPQRPSGMEVLSRPSRQIDPTTQDPAVHVIQPTDADAVPPPPPPKERSRPDGPSRADSFMKRVFTAEVATSEDGVDRSSKHSTELLGSAAWFHPVAEEDEGEGATPRQPVSIISMESGRPPRSSLLLSVPTASGVIVPPESTSPIHSDRGSVYAPSQSTSNAAVAHFPQTRGPPLPNSGPVMPTPLSPARFPGTGVAGAAVKMEAPRLSEQRRSSRRTSADRPPQQQLPPTASSSRSPEQPRSSSRRTSPPTAIPPPSTPSQQSDATIRPNPNRSARSRAPKPDRRYPVEGYTPAPMEMRPQSNSPPMQPYTSPTRTQYTSPTSGAYALPPGAANPVRMQPAGLPRGAYRPPPPRDPFAGH